MSDRARQGGLSDRRRGTLSVKTISTYWARLLVTNLASLEYQTTCLEAGAEFFLDKSFGLERLAVIFRDMARKSGSDFEEGTVL
jgi:hypothetical protein